MPARPDYGASAIVAHADRAQGISIDLLMTGLWAPHLFTAITAATPSPYGFRSATCALCCAPYCKAHAVVIDLNGLSSILCYGFSSHAYAWVAPGGVRWRIELMWMDSSPELSLRWIEWMPS